jgi:hypothetical protein
MIWNEITIKDKKILHVEFGPLDLWINNSDFDGEWLIGKSYTSSPRSERFNALPEDQAPEGLEWGRWISGDSDPVIKLSPAMPDRPVIIRPEIPVTMLPGQLSTLFMEIPVFVKVSIGKNNLDMCEIPSVILSNSWFGSFTEGEQCYSIRTPARRSHNSIGKFPNQVICPIEIANKSEEKLNFNHLCVQVEYLDIYQGDNHMWSNLGSVSYRGEDQWSNVVFNRKEPQYDNAKKIIGKSRKQVKSGIFLKSFGNFNVFF